MFETETCRKRVLALKTVTVCNTPIRHGEVFRSVANCPGRVRNEPARGGRRERAEDETADDVEECCRWNNGED